MSEAYDLQAHQNFKENNSQVNEKYPASIWTFSTVNIYNDYFITCPPKQKKEIIEGHEAIIKRPKEEVSPERKIFDFHLQEKFDIVTNTLSLSNKERAANKDKSIIIGSRYRFYVPLFDKNSNCPWAIYADPTMLFLNNPRTLIENLDSSKTVYVCKHDNYTTKKQTKTLIPSIKYPFAHSLKTFFGDVHKLNDKYEYVKHRVSFEIEPLKELYSPENFEKFDKLFAQRNLSQDDFMKACLAIFKDKKNYMIRNKHIANEKVLEEIYQRWYVNDEMESFDNIDYDRKNWSSFMIFNKEKFKLNWHQLDSYSIEELHQFDWCADEEIGEIPLSWNHLVDEQEDISNPNALNFTIDSPGRYKSNSTSKLNQKYININIAQCLWAWAELPSDEYVINKDLSFEELVKPLINLTPKKLEEFYKYWDIENYSPLEVLYVYLPEFRHQEDPQDEAEFDYDLCNRENAFHIQFYEQDYMSSKNKISDMVATLQDQIKNLTEQDKQEILTLYRQYRLNIILEKLECDEKGEDAPTPHYSDKIQFGKYLTKTVDSHLKQNKCLSIREVTGRII